MTTDELVKQIARQLDRIEYEVQQISRAMVLLLEDDPQQPALDLNGGLSGGERDENQPL